jgi:hypothetical protein
VKLTRNGKFGILAVVAVALIAAGAAFAATQFHNSSASASRGGFGGGPGFAPPSGAYGAPGTDGRGFGGRGFSRRGFGFGLGGPGGTLSAAASYLGLGQSALFQQLQSGKTLAQIANATTGKSAAGLIDAMVAAQKSQIAAAVKAGMLSQAMADRITADAETRISAMVNGSFGPGRGGFFGHRPDDDGGQGFGFGPPRDGGQSPQAPTTTTPTTHI